MTYALLIKVRRELTKNSNVHRTRIHMHAKTPPAGSSVSLLLESITFVHFIELLAGRSVGEGRGHGDKTKLGEGIHSVNNESTINQISFFPPFFISSE